MSGLGIASITIGVGTFISFQSWLAVTIVRTQATVAKLQARMDAQEHQCNERLIWMRSLDTKMDDVKVDVAFIRGKLEKA